MGEARKEIDVVVVVMVVVVVVVMVVVVVKKAWLQVGRVTEKETKENLGQEERVAEAEATLARQGLAIEANQKHGLDQLTMFKKSQSEGLLRQFDKIEGRIEEERSSISQEMAAAKAELDGRSEGVMDHDGGEMGSPAQVPDPRQGGEGLREGEEPGAEHSSTQGGLVGLV